MANKQEYHRDDAIAPVPVNLNAPQRDAAGSSSASVWRQYPLALAGLAVAIIAVVGVVFYLPSVVSPVQGTAWAPSEAAQPASAPRGAPEVTESPWQDAQIAQARQEAQAILQKLLEQQKTLEALRVDLWAPEQFQAALGQAEAADQEYQRREFTAAFAHYQASLMQMQDLEAESQQVFTRALEAGQHAIEDGDVALAQEQLQLAAHINGKHEGVQAALRRAAALKPVLAEVDAGKALQRQGKLDEARGRFQKALELDGESRPAREALVNVERVIAERNFGRHMSTGFAAMTTGNYADAIAAFESALQVRPNADDAQAALIQAQNQSTQSRLQQLVQQAAQHEAKEEWRAAANRYQEALQVDRSLVDARVGSLRAGTRAEIDENMERILSAPERLTTPAVHDDFQLFLEETRRIGNPGPRLQRQLQELEQALHQAVQPVAVLFKSDQTTRVTLYKVAELGVFDQREMPLKPGSYTLVGVRPGYRDVRQTFTVSPGQSSPVITIQCEEKINDG